MRQEGRGIGLAPKIHAYKLQEQGLDTVEANEKLEFAPDLRDYGLGAQILSRPRVTEDQSSHQQSPQGRGVGGYDLEIVKQLPIKSKSNPHNAKYLATKKAKLGHML